MRFDTFSKTKNLNKTIIDQFEKQQLWSPWLIVGPDGVFVSTGPCNLEVSGSNPEGPG